MRKNICIIDYGIGNYASLQGMFNKLNCLSKVTNDRSIIRNSDLIILPGVGTFKTAMNKLKRDKIDKFLISMADNGKLIVGICLGMQVLSSSSTEDGLERGLGIIPGKIIRIKNNVHNIGWSSLKYLKKNTFLRNIDQKNEYYFQHGYHYQGLGKFKLAKSSTYPDITSIIRFKNSIGVQFHPEKSQYSGEIFLFNILKLIK